LVTCHVRVTAVAFHPSSADGGRRKERTGEEKGSSGKKKGKKGEDADGWGRGAVRERARGDEKPSQRCCGPVRRAMRCARGRKNKAGRAAGWAAWGAGQCVSVGQPPSGPRQARQAGKGEEEGRAGSRVGPVGEFFPNPIFFQFYFLHFKF